MKLADAREKRIALRETPIFRVPIGDRDELHRIAESLLECGHIFKLRHGVRALDAVEQRRTMPDFTCCSAVDVRVRVDDAVAERWKTLRFYGVIKRKSVRRVGCCRVRMRREM